MVKAHPYRSVLAVLAVMFVTGFTANRIGQYNEGPWGGLPSWLGAVTWFSFLGAALVLTVLSVYLLAANLQWRRQRSPSA